MLPDRVSNPGPLTYESGVLPTALRGPASRTRAKHKTRQKFTPSPTMTLERYHMTSLLFSE